MISKAKSLDTCIDIAMQVRCDHRARIVHRGLSLSRLRLLKLERKMGSASRLTDLQTNSSQRDTVYWPVHSFVGLINSTLVGMRLEQLPEYD